MLAPSVLLLGPQRRTRFSQNADLTPFLRRCQVLPSKEHPCVRLAAVFFFHEAHHRNAPGPPPPAVVISNHGALNNVKRIKRLSASPASPPLAPPPTRVALSACDPVNRVLLCRLCPSNNSCLMYHRLLAVRTGCSNGCRRSATACYSLHRSV